MKSLIDMDDQQDDPASVAFHLVGMKSMTKVKNGFVATEIIENELLCGIEVAPWESDDQNDGTSTVTTDPITTDQSSSWSLESASNHDIYRQCSENSSNQCSQGTDRERREAFIPNDPTSLQNHDSSGIGSPVYSRPIRPKPPPPSPIRGARTRKLSAIKKQKELNAIVMHKTRKRGSHVDDILMMTFDDDEMETNSSDTDCPGPPKLVRCTDEEVTTDRHQKVQAGFQIINLVEPRPDTTFCTMVLRTHSLLHNMTLRAGDVPFLFPVQVPPMANLTTPFVMFPNRSSAVVFKEEDVDAYQISTRGPISGSEFLSHLFELHAEHISACRTVLQSFGFRDSIPPVSKSVPLPLDKSSIRIQLGEWRRNSRRKSKEKKRALFAAAADAEFEIEKQDPSRFVCTPKLLSLVAGSQKGDSVSDFLKDQELRDVMQITLDGDDASILFPSFSLDSTSTCESDDGLKDELNALDEIEDDIRRDLEFVDYPIHSTALSEDHLFDSASSADYYELHDPFLGKPDPEQQMKGMQEMSDSDETMPLTDSSDAESSTERPRIRTVRIPGSEGRRVRFSDDVREYVFEKDPSLYLGNANPNCGFDQSENDGGSIPRAKPKSDMMLSLEEVYYVFEDFMDEIGYSCTRATQRKSRMNVPGRREKLSSYF